MTPTIIAIIIGEIILIVGIIWLAFYFTKKKYHTTWNNMSMIASNYGVQLETPKYTAFKTLYPGFHATHNGHQLEVRSEVIKHGKSTEYHTNIIITTTAKHDFKFRLAKENIFRKIGTAFGMPDVKTGNDDFDTEFVLRTKSPDLVPHYFDMMTCGDILANEKMLLTPLDYENGVLKMRTNSLIDSEFRLQTYVTLIPFMLTLAEKLAAKSRSAIH